MLNNVYYHVISNSKKKEEKCKWLLIGKINNGTSLCNAVQALKRRLKSVCTNLIISEKWRIQNCMWWSYLC